MVTLNRNSWFVRKYLGYPPYLESILPKTVCQLINQILLMTMYYVLLWSVALLITVMYSAGLIGMVYVAFTDQTIAEFFMLENPESGFWSLAFTAFCAINIVAVIMLTLYIVAVSITKLKRVLNQSDSAKNPESSNTAVTIIRGAWERFRNKTCVLIEWDEKNT